MPENGLTFPGRSLHSLFAKHISLLGKAQLRDTYLLG